MKENLRHLVAHVVEDELNLDPIFDGGRDHVHQQSQNIDHGEGGQHQGEVTEKFARDVAIERIRESEDDTRDADHDDGSRTATNAIFEWSL